MSILEKKRRKERKEEKTKEKKFKTHIIIKLDFKEIGSGRTSWDL